MVYKKQRGSVAILVPVILVIIAGAIGWGAAKITKKDDGEIEETAEQFIKDETGKDIDLTPGSPEKGS